MQRTAVCSSRSGCRRVDKRSPDRRPLPGMALRRLLAPAGYSSLSRSPVCVVLAPGGLTPAGAEVGSLVTAVWASRVATEAWALDLPHVLKYGGTAAGAAGAAAAGDVGAGSVMSVDEARNLVEGALFAHMAASPHVARFVFVSFSMGAFFVLRAWPALARVAAARGRCGADVRGVFCGCAAAVSDESREVIRGAQTPEFMSSVMDLPALLGPHYASVLRCVREWCCGAPPPARPGETLFAPDEAARAAVVADPSKHFVLGADDHVHSPAASFGAAVPPPRVRLLKGGVVVTPLPPAPAGRSSWCAGAVWRAACACGLTKIAESFVGMFAYLLSWRPLSHVVLAGRYDVPGSHFSMLSGPVFRQLVSEVLGEMVLGGDAPAVDGGEGSKL